MADHAPIPGRRSPVPDWWQDEPVLRRFVSHLLAAELRALRPGTAPEPPAGPWPDDLRLDETGLAVDSLDRMQLATALAETLVLPLGRREAALLAHREFGAWLAACRGALPAQAVLRFRTSGSTGLPQTWRHPLAGLAEEAAFLATLFPGRRRLLAAVPAHHIYGFLFTVLLPQRLGGLPVEDLATPAELPGRWRSGDLVIGFPDFWRGVARLAHPAPTDVLGTTSTGPCPAEVAIALGALGVGLTEVFGSSETAGLGWRTEPDSPFRWFPWWRPAGEDKVVRRLPDDGEVTAPLPDRMEPAGPGLFRPAGRRDGVVAVGGVNVSPARVRERLLTHPWVADAAVRLMRPEEGTRLKAFVVPRPEAPPAAQCREDPVAWIEVHLPPAERPRALRLGRELPRGTLGKAADWDA